ncbi:MAG: bifunctional transaldolase/phosoglucose isomerase, partial [Acidobacteriota bacterium]|jgi:transaldolase/glucose-6-phosphate isomerase
VREEGVRGVTSNPAIFHKAIARGGEYDAQIAALARQGAAVQEIYEQLVVEDVRAACDVLRPLYEASDGGDGFVSLEVSPYLIHDPEGTLAEARRLWAAVGRPNLMIKIPGSPAGVAAIQEALAEGINVNVTLLFAVDAYEAVTEAYLAALERRLAAGAPVERLASVASFFVSRIDTLVDQLLGHRLGVPGAGPRAAALLGQAAIANARLAYASFQRLFSGPRWEAMAARGARVQRLLWASTSTKDPLYEDTRYVTPLVGPHTVNTMPEETIAAFADHGRLDGPGVATGLEEAQAVLAQLGELGIDVRAVTTQLLNEGAQKFMEPFDALLASIAARRQAALSLPAGEMTTSPAAAGGAATDVARALDARQFGRRLWARDPSLWSPEEGVQVAIRHRLGWLHAATDFSPRLGEVQRLAGEVVAEGYRHVVLLGMGGSSLCPEVCARIFGPAHGHPQLLVLDSTDPDAVRAVEDRLEPGRTLFLVASKSGTTVETACLQKYFWGRTVAAAGESGAGRHFVAITDPGTPLAAEGRELGYRAVLENPADIGGRFSALSYFGLLPMALLGIDTGEVLARARRMALSCGGEVPATANPGVRLGAVLGGHALRGRNVLALALSPTLAPLGAWVEQLVAESTGKQGKGILPLAGMPDTPAQASRCVTVAVTLRGEEDPEMARRLEALAGAGHPVVRLELADRLELGAEFLRWEIATATAGAVLGVNPFDEPNVNESKALTRSLLARHEPPAPPVAAAGALQCFGPHVERQDAPLAGLLSPAPAYLAVLAFFAPTPEREEALERLRRRLAARLEGPVTAGFGPRYLHSTGQLHKGGFAGGAFLVLTADPRATLSIPGEPFDFTRLLHAQAEGDFQALLARGRRAARVHLGADPLAGLKELVALV